MPTLDENHAGVALLIRVKGLLDSGYRISEAARILARDAEAAAEPEPAWELDSGLEPVRAGLLLALLAYDLEGAERLLRRVVTLPFESLLDQVYLPLLQQVGILWEEGRATVVQEHFVSAWCRERILAMARSVETGQPGAPEAFVATAEGERHEFGALGVSFHLANRGYRVLYLGADVPTDQLHQLVAHRRPSLVAVSVVLDRLLFGAKASAVVGRALRIAS